MELYGFARLDADQLAQVQAFEADTGKRLLVLRALDMSFAPLRPEELASLRVLEERLGNIVLAVR